MTVQEAVGKNINLLGIKPSAKLAQESLLPNEEVLYAFGRTSVGPRGLENGVAVVTQERVFFCSNLLFGTSRRITQIPIDKIQGVQLQGPHAGTYQLHIQGVTDSIVMLGTMQELNALNTAIQKVIHSKDEVTLTNSMPDDVEQQLQKIKNLLDNQLITQAEYDAKKKQLLGL